MTRRQWENQLDIFSLPTTLMSPLACVECNAVLCISCSLLAEKLVQSSLLPSLGSREWLLSPPQSPSPGQQLACVRAERWLGDIRIECVKAKGLCWCSLPCICLPSRCQPYVGMPVTYTGNVAATSALSIWQCTATSETPVMRPVFNSKKP